MVGNRLAVSGVRVVLEAIGGNLGASAAMNALLREFGSARRGKTYLVEHEVQAAQSAGRIHGKSELSEEERKEVQELKRRDQEVRRHEAAHKAAAGPYARGGASFEFTTGPDGRRYATGGEVQIDTSEVPGDPQATLKKMQQIRRAAGAPAEPSAQDRRVAAQAAATESKARAELSQERLPGNDENTFDGSETNGTLSSKSPFATDRPFTRQVQQTLHPGTFIDLTV